MAIENTARRRFLLLLCMLPLIGRHLFQQRSKNIDDSGGDFVVVRGWILKKSDLLEDQVYVHRSQQG